MKIAVVFYGQPRDVVDSYPSIKERLLENSNVEIDLFAHMWESHEYKEALELYKFKEVKLEQPKDFSNLYEGKSGFCPKSFTLYPMWYSIQSGCTLLKNYIQQNNVEYDFVVRIRFDMFFHHNLVFDNLDKTLLYTSEAAWGGHPYLFDDSWGICGQNIYFQIYEDIYSKLVERHINRNFVHRGEENTYEHINNIGLLSFVKRERMLDFALNRDKGVNYDYSHRNSSNES